MNLKWKILVLEVASFLLVAGAQASPSQRTCSEVLSGLLKEVQATLRAAGIRANAAIARLGGGVEAQSLVYHTFKRNTQYTALGKAWADPSGLIWGDKTLNYMTQRMAEDYCRSIGAELPTEEDFRKLREYLGAEPGTRNGYVRQILPNLNDIFWSSSAPDRSDGAAYYFDGANGDIVKGFVVCNYAVRCVVRPSVE